jgi:hypothetical protein
VGMGIAQFIRNGRRCCYNITLPGVHGRIASKRDLVRGASARGVPDTAQRAAYTSASMIGGREDAERSSFRRLDRPLQLDRSLGEWPVLLDLMSGKPKIAVVNIRIVTT